MERRDTFGSFGAMRLVRSSALLLVAVAFLVACAPEPTCRSAIDHLQDVREAFVKEKVSAEAHAPWAAISPKMRQALMTTCVDDEWSTEVISCLHNVKSLDDIKVCHDKLTPEQRAHQKATTSEVLNANMPTPPPGLDVRFGSGS
ncbi:MAG: hypothetical protein AB7L28_19215 [Kofleriaceae bacterium]